MDILDLRSCEDVLDLMMIGGSVPRMFEVEAIRLQSTALGDLITRIDELDEAQSGDQIKVLWRDLVAISRTYDEMLRADLMIEMPVSEVLP